MRLKRRTDLLRIHWNDANWQIEAYSSELTENLDVGLIQFCWIFAVVDQQLVVDGVSSTQPGNMLSCTILLDGTVFGAPQPKYTQGQVVHYNGKITISNKEIEGAKAPTFMQRNQSVQDSQPPKERQYFELSFTNGQLIDVIEVQEPKPTTPTQPNTGRYSWTQHQTPHQS